jgi:hypothetical protein
MRRETDPVSETLYFFVFRILERWTESRSAVTLSAIHRRQNPSDTTYGALKHWESPSQSRCFQRWMGQDENDVTLNICSAFARCHLNGRVLPEHHGNTQNTPRRLLLSGLWAQSSNNFFPPSNSATLCSRNDLTSWYRKKNYVGT